MASLNFLEIHERERYLWRLAQGISRAVLRPLVVLSIVGLISLIAFVAQQNEVRGLDRDVADLQQKSDRLATRIVSQRTDLARLRSLIAIDSEIFAAKNSGAKVSNMHATLANLLHPQTRLTSIVQGRGPIILSGTAPTYSAIGFSLGQLSKSLGPMEVGLESARSLQTHRSGDGVSFVLHVRIPDSCCHFVR